MEKTIDYTALADTIRAEINARHDRSAWDKAVTLYALDLLDDVQEGANNMERLPLDGAELERWALNGASCWEQYSNGGCSICYDADIAARVCTPSELKRTDGGMNAPNSRETWLDVQPARCIRLVTVSAKSAALTACIIRRCNSMMITIDFSQWAALWYVGGMISGALVMIAFLNS